MLGYLKNKNILVIVAHPDDELLGIGGTINKLVKTHNANVKVVILGEGITSRDNERDIDKRKKELEKHRKNILDAKKSIGYQELSIYQFPDNRFDSVDLLDIIKVVEKEKQKFNPYIIFTHHGGDVNIDHQRTFEAVITATRPMKEECTKAIITFETPSGTEWRASTDPKHFIPNFFVSLSKENINAKIKGMESYEFEKRKYPHPRAPKSLEILAMRRGVQIGEEYAEAFNIVRFKS